MTTTNFQLRELAGARSGLYRIVSSPTGTSQVAGIQKVQVRSGLGAGPFQDPAGASVLYARREKPGDALDIAIQLVADRVPLGPAVPALTQEQVAAQIAAALENAPSPQGVGDSWYGSTTTDVSGTTGVAVTFDTNYGAEVDSFTSAPLTVVDACVLAITIAVQVNTGTGAATLKIGDLPNGPTVVVSKTLDGTESSDERILFLEVTSLVTAGYVPKFSYAAPAGLSYAECSVSRVT